MQSLGYSNENWIGQLAMHDPQLSLRTIIIPSSHNSASSTIRKSKLLSGAARCQNLSITEQLKLGIRFFDIRVGKTGDNNTDFKVVHGIFTGEDVLNVFSEIIVFLKLHPHEFIFIDLINEHGRGLTNGQKRSFFTYLIQSLGELTVKGTDKDFPDFKPAFAKIGKLSFDHRCLFITVDPSFYNFEYDGKIMKGTEMRNLGFFNRSTLMKNKWHNKDDVEDLIHENLNFVKENSTCDHRYIVNQFSLTPNTEAKGVLKMFLNPKNLMVKNGVKKMLEGNRLHKIIRQETDLKWNFLWFDYVDLIPKLIDYLIGLNFPYELKIKRAVLNRDGISIVKTEECRKIIKKKNSLFILDFKEDLQIQEDFSFCRFEVEYVFFRDHLEFKGLDEVTIKPDEIYLLNFPKIITEFMY